MAEPKVPCTPEAMEALRLTKAAAIRGNLILTRHARERMRERGAQVKDVENAIDGATVAKLQESGAWRLLGGADLEGDELDVIVDVGWDPIRVVTIM